MQSPPAWFLPMGAQQRSLLFPHLRTVPPPPPLITTARPERFQQPFELTRATAIPMNNEHPRFFGKGRGKSRGRGHKAQSGGRGKDAKKGPKQKPKITPEISVKLKPTCDTCDRTFPSEADLSHHVTFEHTTCGLEGCSFSAHPKVVALHVNMQHHTGLYKRLVTGTDPDEVQRWRDERKKHFPTLQNMQRKQQAANERSERGERISKPRGRFNRRDNWSRQPSLSSALTKNISNKCETNTNQCVDPLDMVQAVVTETDYSNTAAKKKEASITLPSALANIAGNYATDSDSDEAPEEMPIGRESVAPEPEAKKMKVEIPRRDEREIRQQPTVRQQFLTRRRPPTLLQKLLASEIRHERNVILQCVRHVVLNNFFQ